MVLGGAGGFVVESLDAVDHRIRAAGRTNDSSDQRTTHNTRNDCADPVLLSESFDCVERLANSPLSVEGGPQTTRVNLTINGCSQLTRGNVCIFADVNYFELKLSFVFHRYSLLSTS